jgi:hypothetical protein
MSAPIWIIAYRVDVETNAAEPQYPSILVCERAKERKSACLIGNLTETELWVHCAMPVADTQ